MTSKKPFYAAQNGRSLPFMFDACGTPSKHQSGAHGLRSTILVYSHACTTNKARAYNSRDQRETKSDVASPVQRQVATRSGSRVRLERGYMSTPRLLPQCPLASRLRDCIQESLIGRRTHNVAGEPRPPADSTRERARSDGDIGTGWADWDDPRLLELVLAHAGTWV